LRPSLVAARASFRFAESFGGLSHNLLLESQCRSHECDHTFAQQVESRGPCSEIGFGAVNIVIENECRR
jgi:hypothetical protein